MTLVPLCSAGFESVADDNFASLIDRVNLKNGLGQIEADPVMSTGYAGQALFTPAGVHMPTNVGDKPFEAILAELKGHCGKK